jgi:hypothetical protein
MSAKIAAYIRQHHLALLCLFLIMSGGTAYATHPGGENTISSTDIIDNEVKTQDVRDGNIRREDIRTDAVVTEHIATGAVQSIDVADDTTSGALTGTDVLNNSLTGTDVDESSLFNDNSLDASDVSNASTLAAAEINEAGLGIVPSATNATMVQGNEVRVVPFATGNNAGSQSFGGAGALSVDSQCNRTAFGQTAGDLDVQVSTDADNSTLAVSDDDSYADIEDFDIADGDVDLATLVGADSDEIINLVYTKPNPASGFKPVVSGQIHILDDAPDGDTPECVLAGHLIFHD